MNEGRAEAPADTQEIFAILRERIRKRIGPVVTHLPPPEVDALVERIARIKFKYDGKSALRATPSAGGDAIQAVSPPPGD